MASPWLIPPDNISSPSSLHTGTDSPVNAEKSIYVFPFIILLSTGTLSPFFIRMVSPIFNSDGSTSTHSPFLNTLAILGAISTKEDIDLLDFPTAMCSKSSPIAKNNITATASTYSPIAKAAIEAIVMRNFSFRKSK